MTARRSRVWAALAIDYVVWGSTYLAIKIALRSVSPFMLGASRFAVAGAVVGGIGLALARRSGERVAWREEWRGALLPGFLLFAMGNGSIAWAQVRLDSGVTALVVCGVPLWLALFDRLLYGRRLSGAAGCGIVLGFVGAAVLVGPGGGGHVDALGVLGVSAGSVCWALGSLRSRQAAASAGTNPLLASGVQMAWGALFLVGFATANGEPWQAGAPGWEAVGGIAYLVLVGTLVGFTLYAWLLRNAPTPLVSTYAFANPVVAVLLGWGIEHEPLGPRTLAAAALIVGAVGLIVLAQARESRAAATLGA